MAIQWPYEFPGAYWVDDAESNAVMQVLEHGTMFRYYGLDTPRFVDAYEKAAREFYGARFALAVNSGTGALATAMTALGIGPGAEVIVPAFMWVATVGAIVQANAIPVLCEVDESLNMDARDLERKITPRTRLIIPIHMAGAPCNMEAIMAVANKHGIPVLEDCAQCNGGEFHGRKVGTFGRMGIFSLQLNKNMTCGEGGLIITDDEQLYTKAFSSHDMGLIRVNGRLAMPEPDAISWGAGRRMNEMSGAVASVQITKLPQILNRMRSSKRRIKEMIQDLPKITFRRLDDPSGDTGPFLVFFVEDEAKAIQVLDGMREAGLHNTMRIADYGLHIYYNIPSLVQKVPLSPAGNPWSLEANRASVYDYNKGACPISDALFARAILLPIPSCLTSEQEDQAIEILRSAIGR